MPLPIATAEDALPLVAMPALLLLAAPLPAVAALHNTEAY